jgi:hypothetical protein
LKPLYINTLQGAFTELTECGEEFAVPEREKVDIFLDGLADDRYASLRMVIMSNPATRNDFQATYTFGEMMEWFSSMGTGPGGVDRNISEVAAGKKSGKHGKDYIPKAKWDAMSKEERTAAMEKRDAKKGGGGGKKRKGGGKGLSPEGK